MSVGYIHLGNTVCSLGWGDHIFEIWDNTFRVFVDSILFWGQKYSRALSTAINLVEILDAPSECDAWVFKDRVNAFFFSKSELWLLHCAIQLPTETVQYKVMRKINPTINRVGSTRKFQFLLSGGPWGFMIKNYEGNKFVDAGLEQIAYSTGIVTIRTAAQVESHMTINWKCFGFESESICIPNWKPSVSTIAPQRKCAHSRTCTVATHNP